MVGDQAVGEEASKQGLVARDHEFDADAGGSLHLADRTKRWVGAFEGAELLRAGRGPPGDAVVAAVLDRDRAADAFDQPFEMLGRDEGGDAVDGDQAQRRKLLFGRQKFGLIDRGRRLAA